MTNPAPPGIFNPSHSPSDIPLRLFKYLPPDTHIPKIRDILEGSQLYFATHEKLNDPYDCRPVLKPMTDAESISYQVRASNRRHSYENRAQWRGAKKKMRNSLKDPQLMEEAFRREHEKWGVCSLCTEFDSGPLWAHYADNHKGVCIEFDHELLCKQGHPAMRVIYSKSRPPLPMGDVLLKGNLERMVQAAMLTKSTEWSYEHEFRMINKPAGSAKIDPATIVAVHLGSNASGELRKLVGEWCLTRVKPPLMYEMILSRDRYEISRKRVEL